MEAIYKCLDKHIDLDKIISISDISFERIDGVRPILKFYVHFQLSDKGREFYMYLHDKQYDGYIVRLINGDKEYQGPDLEDDHKLSEILPKIKHAAKIIDARNDLIETWRNYKNNSKIAN